MSVSRKINWLRDVRRRYGWRAALRSLFSQGLRKLCRLEVNELVWLSDRTLRADLALDPEFKVRFLSTNEVALLVSDPTYELAPEFVSRASAGLDLCFAALDSSGKVANYSWYVLVSIEGEHHVGVPLSFPADTAYMYNAFTHPSFRGRHLHAAAVKQVLPRLAERGITRVIASIEWTNFASLHSFERIGCQRLGRLWALGRGERRECISPRAARTIGIRFGSDAEVRERPPNTATPPIDVAPTTDQPVNA